MPYRTSSNRKFPVQLRATVIARWDEEETLYIEEVMQLDSRRLYNRQKLIAFHDAINDGARADRR